jgi:asparagine synthetase B (glutamine-hydrolysing)
MTIPSEYVPLKATSRSVQALRERLVTSLSRRVQNVPCPPLCGGQDDTRIAVLFSGGLDCTVLARLASDLAPSIQGIDLINVAFENPRVISAAAALSCGQGPAVNEEFESCLDRITGRKSFSALVNACPARKWRFVAVSQAVMLHLDLHPMFTDISRSTSRTRRLSPVEKK